MYPSWWHDVCVLKKNIQDWLRLRVCVSFYYLFLLRKIYPAKNERRKRLQRRTGGQNWWMYTSVVSRQKWKKKEASATNWWTKLVNVHQCSVVKKNICKKTGRGWTCTFEWNLWARMYTNAVKKNSAEIGSNVHQCSVVEKNHFCHWSEILLAPMYTVGKKKYPKVRLRLDVYIGVNLLTRMYTSVV